MRIFRNVIWMLLAGLLFSSNAFAQGIQSMNISPESILKVEGTCNLHDWHCDVELDQTIIEFSEVDGKLLPQQLKFEIPVKNMDSGKGMMNKLMYKSMKEKDYSSIIYQLDEVKLVANCPAGILARFITVGQLEIAGVKKQVEMTVDMVKNTEGELRLEGNKVIKMTDYGIDPPKAMFGTITTGDAITVSFNLKVSS